MKLGKAKAQKVTENHQEDEESFGAPEVEEPPRHRTSFITAQRELEGAAAAGDRKRSLSDASKTLRNSLSKESASNLRSPSAKHVASTLLQVKPPKKAKPSPSKASVGRASPGKASPGKRAVGKGSPGKIMDLLNKLCPPKSKSPRSKEKVQSQREIDEKMLFDEDPPSSKKPEKPDSPRKVAYERIQINGCEFYRA